MKPEIRIRVVLWQRLSYVAKKITEHHTMDEAIDFVLMLEPQAKMETANGEIIFWDPNNQYDMLASINISFQ